MSGCDKRLGWHLHSLTRSLGFGSVERESAEERMEGFLEIRVT